MLNLNDLILLKALYNEELHNAILSKDKAAIEAIVIECYLDQLKGGLSSLESLNTDRLYADHTEQLEDEEMLKRLK
jgi:hypothetical protein